MPDGQNQLPPLRPSISLSVESGAGDTSGNPTSAVRFADDGGLYESGTATLTEIVEYPTPSSPDSSKTDKVYDSDGKLILQTTFDPDGTIASTKSVVWNADGSSIARIKNDAGQLISLEISGADGSRDVTVYDMPGQTRPSTEKVYDASQTLRSTTVRNVDGSKSVTVFEITGQIYVSVQTFYDPSGQGTAQSFFDANGRLIQSDVIATGSTRHHLHRRFWLRDEGQIARVRNAAVTMGSDVGGTIGMNDAQARRVRRPGLPNVQHTWMSASNGAGGNLTFETFYNADGSTYETDAATETVHWDESTIVNYVNPNGTIFDHNPNGTPRTAESLPTVIITRAAEASINANRIITGTVASGGAAAVIGQTVTLTDNGTVVATAKVQADGTFSASITLPKQGANSIVATATDSSGNTGTSAAVVDILANGPPAVEFGSQQSSSAVFGFSGGHWTVTVGGKTTTLIGIEKVTFADKTFELVDQLGAAVGGFQTVQSAIDAASGRETILVAPGTYKETAILGPYGLTPGGFFIDKPNLTLQGVKSDGSFVTSAADAKASGPTIISGSETEYGSNLFIGPNAAGTVLQGLHLAAGPKTTNNLVEFWTNNVTIENDFIDAVVNGTDTQAAAIYINVSGTPITQYLITGNILNESIVVANGVGTAGQEISTTQVISNNIFEGTFDNSSGDGRYEMIAVQGQIPGVSWQTDPAQVPTIKGNVLTDNQAPFIFRMTELNPALFPSANELAKFLAQNTSASTSYAYVLNPDGTLHLADRFIRSGFVKALYVANSLENLNKGLTGPNAIYRSHIETMAAGDTVVMQTVGTTIENVTVDNLTIKPNANSTALTLKLADGVSALTLADYSAGQGAGVTVVGNNLGDMLKANSGNDILIGGIGNDTFVAGSGNDILTGGGGYDFYKIGSAFGHTQINNSAADGITTPQGEVDFGSGVSDEQLWFVRSGNDLQVDLLGTSDRLMLAGWYSDPRAQVRSFNTADGLKLDSQVSQLVSTMATYAANNPAFNPTTATEMPNDGTLQYAISAAWH